MREFVRLQPHRMLRRLAIAAMLALAGCAGKPLLPSIPQKLVDAARIPGLDRVRQWGDESGALATGMPATPAAQRGGALNVLAISGGGQNGSFAAGLLSGWTRAGTRPEFHVVTGVSAGALAAPFAFLGPRYDAVLAEIFTGFAGADLVAPKNRMAALLGDSLASAAPLEALIERYFDEPLMREIAAAHRSGRRLYVATTHVYAGRQVIWDIGAIAERGDEEALALIRRVLLASSSVPILLPPVFIEVEAHGARYSEMHVDGGITRQVFAGPPDLDWAALGRALGTDGETNFYVVRNGRATPEYMVMNPQIVGLGEHAMHQLTQSLGVGDLHRIYLRARRENARFRAAWIGEDFTAPWGDWFDRKYVAALFDYGRSMAERPQVWRALPPGPE
jgi:hypothetical protein